LPGQVAFTEVKWKVLAPNTMKQYLADLEAGEASVSAHSVSPPRVMKTYPTT